MCPPREPESDFELEMMASGVRPLRPAKAADGLLSPGKEREAHPTPGAGRAVPPPSTEARAKGPSDMLSAVKAPAPDPEARAHEETRARLAAAEVRLSQLQAQHAEAQKEASSQLSAVERRLAEAETRYEEAHAERQSLSRRLNDGTPRRASPDGGSDPEHSAAQRHGRRPRAAFYDHDPADHPRILAAALRVDPRGFIAALETADTLTEWLNTHVAVACTAPTCRPKAPIAHVEVPPERCEVCGGSDIRRAWTELCATAKAAGITTLGVVGGSPAYHEQLRDLSSGTPGLRLRVVDGTSRQTRKDAQAVQNADVVVIWCATELNHAVTASYRPDRGRLFHVPVRGIARMLREVSARLRT